MTQHPPVHHPKNPIPGFHGWDERVPHGSVYLVSSSFFSSCLFLFVFPSDCFVLFCFGSSLFFLPGLILVFLFSPATLSIVSFLGNSYRPLQPTHHPSSYQPIYLPTFTEPAHLPPSFWSPLTCACALLHHQHLRFSGFRVAEL